MNAKQRGNGNEKERLIMADGYMKMIDRAGSLDELDAIAEAAAYNSGISNKDYADIVEYGIRKAQRWASGEM